MMRYPFSLIVLVFPLLWFLVDKVFGLEIVKDYNIPWKKIEIFFYESKEDLLEVYLNNLPSHIKKSEARMVILGTSRSGEFSTHSIQKIFPNTVTYNFSAPFAGHLFHYYWLERILKIDPGLSLVILEVDPLTFSKSSLNYTLSYSLDFPFVWNNSEFFPLRLQDPWDAGAELGMSWDEAETWFSKKLFLSYRYPLDWNAIRENKENTMAFLDGKIISVSGKDYKKIFKDMIFNANRQELGAIPNQIFHQGDENFLKKDAENMANIHLGEQFKPSLTQIVFFKKILALTSKNNIDLVIYWPVVSKYFREELIKRNLVSEYKELIENELKNNSILYPNWKFALWDPYELKEFQCRAFVDSVHLSGGCYNNLFSTLQFILRK